LTKALEVFRNAAGQSSRKDSMIYNNMLDGCIRHGRYDLADDLLTEMEKFEVVPSNYTFGIIVKLFSRRRQLDKAFDLLERMSLKYKITPNTQVRTCLMCACLNSSNFSKATDVFEQLKTSPSGADAKVHSSLISGLVRHRQLNRAVKIVEEAYGLKGKPSMPKGQSLEVETLEKVFTALSQRGLTESMGIPLIQSLRTIGVPLSSKLCNAVLCGNLHSNQKERETFGKDRKHGTNSCAHW
jgi:pentatricopeptide repeat protein